jgi:aspartate aminotransferase-like enzyme
VLEGHRDRKTPATPCVPLYYALARQLEDITSGRTLPARDRGKSGPAAWNARYAKHERMRAAAIAWGAQHGFETFPPPELSAPTVSCFRAGSLDVSDFLGKLKKRGHEIGNGYGTLKGETFRIGHMGDHTEEGLSDLLRCAGEVLRA